MYRGMQEVLNPDIKMPGNTEYIISWVGASTLER